MPSSGYGMVDLIKEPCSTVASCTEHSRKCRQLIEAAQRAMALGLFVEWLESFVATWEKTNDVDEAAAAGLIEWDM